MQDLAKYPENVRIAISYDKLPVHVGPVWEHFPNHAQWNELTLSARNCDIGHDHISY